LEAYLGQRSVGSECGVRVRMPEHRVGDSRARLELAVDEGFEEEERFDNQCLRFSSTDTSIGKQSLSNFSLQSNSKQLLEIFSASFEQFGNIFLIEGGSDSDEKRVSVFGADRRNSRNFFGEKVGRGFETSFLFFFSSSGMFQPSHTNAELSTTRTILPLCVCVCVCECVCV